MCKISKQDLEKWEVHLWNGLGSTGENIIVRKKLK